MSAAISPLASEPGLADEMSRLTADELTAAILAAPSTDALAALSDAELANALVENVLADEPAPSPRFFLLQAVVERLRSWIPAAESGVVLARDNRDELLAAATRFTFGRMPAELAAWAPETEARRWIVVDGRGHIHTAARELDANEAGR